MPVGQVLRLPGVGVNWKAVGGRRSARPTSVTSAVCLPCDFTLEIIAETLCLYGDRSLFPARDEQGLVGRAQISDLAGYRGSRLRGDGGTWPNSEGGRCRDSEACALFDPRDPGDREADESRRDCFSRKRCRVGRAGGAMDSPGAYVLRHFGYDAGRAAK